MSAVAEAVRWWDRHQVALYLVAIVGGAAVGILVPGVAPTFGELITPLLGLLLFATFLGVPVTDVARGARDIRFLVTMLLVNFVLAPVLVFVLSRFVADDLGLLVGVVLVLVAPCVDYVIVFTGLAGGARARLLAVTPVLMGAQIVLLPLYLLLFAGPAAVGSISVWPFVWAFLLLIALPLGVAAAVQYLGRPRTDARGRGTAPAARVAGAVERAGAVLMVPLMVATLAVVVGSQSAAVGEAWASLLRVVPVFAVFALVMVLLGLAAGRSARLDRPATRAVMFSGATRNSLVVLPLALALPPALAIAPLVVVTQTLVELVAMVVFVRLVPWLTRPAGGPAAGSGTAAGDGSGARSR